MGNVVRRCSTFIRIKRGFGYAQGFCSKSSKTIDIGESSVANL
jgi:hypothetical protein